MNKVNTSIMITQFEAMAKHYVQAGLVDAKDVQEMSESLKDLDKETTSETVFAVIFNVFMVFKQGLKQLQPKEENKE